MGFDHALEANGVNMNSMFVTMCQSYSPEVLNVTKVLVVNQTLLYRKTMMRVGAAKKTSQFLSNSMCPP